MSGVLVAIRDLILKSVAAGEFSAANGLVSALRPYVEGSRRRQAHAWIASEAIKAASAAGQPIYFGVYDLRHKPDLPVIVTGRFESGRVGGTVGGCSSYLVVGWSALKPLSAPYVEVGDLFFDATFGAYLVPARTTMWFGDFGELKLVRKSAGETCPWWQARISKVFRGETGQVEKIWLVLLPTTRGTVSFPELSILEGRGDGEQFVVLEEVASLLSSNEGCEDPYEDPYQVTDLEEVPLVDRPGWFLDLVRS